MQGRADSPTRVTGTCGECDEDFEYDYYGGAKKGYCPACRPIVRRRREREKNQRRMADPARRARTQERRRKGVRRYAKTAKGQQRRAARKQARITATPLGQGFTFAHIKAKHEFQAGLCIACLAELGPVEASPAGYHIDHWHPVSRGGSDLPSNIVLLCPPCNLSKSDKLPDNEWIPEAA